MFKGRQLSGSIDLKTAFNNGDIIREGNNFDEILAGLTMQPSESYDTNFVEDVSSYRNNFCHPMVKTKSNERNVHSQTLSISTKTEQRN